MEGTEPIELVINIKSWKSTDKYPCPKCGKRIRTPYLCVPCNIKIKPVIKF